MKKLLLSLAGVVIGSTAMSQYIFHINTPASISTNYDFTGPDNGDSWGLSSLSGVQVTDTLIFVEDGTAGTSPNNHPLSEEGCNPLTNASAVNGKIACIYRNTCNFGVKALHAQQAGAVAVIIINREEALMNMSGGTEGGSVTIPVIFVTASTGAAIKTQITGGQTVVGFIGDKRNLFLNDLASLKGEILRANAGIRPTQITQDGSDFSIVPGLQIRNFGQNDQTNVKLNAKIMKGATVLYNQTSTPTDLTSGDSLFLTLPVFAPSSYSAGEYVINYSITSDSTETDTTDNYITNEFTLGNKIWSLARADQYGNPTNDGGIRGTSTGAGLFFRGCEVFRDSNASRLTLYGLTGEISVATGKAPAGEEVQFIAYQWDHQFTDLNDANITAFGDIMTDLNEIGNTSIFMESTDLLDTTLYAAFDTPVQLLDNQRYLFCIVVNEDSLYVGYDNKTNYEANISEDAQPRYPVYVADQSTGSGGTWFSGFVGGPVPAIGAVMMDPLGLAENEISASVFPNPAKDVVTVKLNQNGKAKLIVTDMAGRTVSTQPVEVVNGQFSTNVSGFTTGAYLFNVLFDNGKTSRFNVVVTK